MKPTVKSRLAGPIARLQCVAFLLAGSISQAVSGASGAGSLERFFSEVSTFEASFVQVVLDENLDTLDESAGRMWMSRPGRFRWNYEPPNEQQIVGDGQNLWIFDPELEQVTVRNMDESLGRSPAILLAGDGEFDELYEVEDLGPQGNIDWVSIKPKNEEGSFSQVQLGFESDQLKLIQLLDRLEQITRIILTDPETNPALSSDVFEFSPPPGVDVIDERVDQ
jgi:outer membrane lipoprotein carrier protein